MHCPSCGSQIEYEDQNYCEGCGFKLPSDFGEKLINEKKTSEVSPTISETTLQDPSEGLFGKKQKYYVLKRNYWKDDITEIFNKKEKVIGRLKVKKEHGVKYHKVFEKDGKLAAISHIRELKDPKGNLIIELEKKISAIINPTYTLHDKINNKPYHLQIKSNDAYTHKRGFFIHVFDKLNKNLISEIEVTGRVRNKIIIMINDKDSERRVSFFSALAVVRIILDTNVWKQKKLEL